ncbi:MAG: hypothetical protein ABJQ37_15575 [Reichenbachiella sp.]|uniref:hypothetical protein n=1 Tax=Reichenbachiella sp. TaxID=2184521 RepID=UPI0032978C89
MITLSVLLVFIGFFVLYMGSRRVELSLNWPLVQWVRRQNINTKGAGIALFLMAALLSVQLWGVAAGVLFFFIQLMTIGSLIVLLTPLQVLNYKFIMTLVVISFFIEMIRYAS